MNWFFHPQAALAALFLGSALAAQVQQPIPCPRLMAQLVPAAQHVGPSVTCGTGIKIELGGVTYTSAVTGCPLFVIFYPPHDVPQSSGTDTWVFEDGKVEAILFRLQCVTSRLIFIPLGSSCEHVDKSSVGTFTSLTTVPCRIGAVDRVQNPE